LKTGATVTLVPSLGPPPVDVPDLTGKTLDQARAALGDAHLALGKQTPRFSDLPVGTIVAWHPTGTAPKGSAIAVDVSKGPAPVPVQNVVGKTQDEAVQILGPQGQGYQVVTKTKFSTDIERGRVIAQSPDPGTKLQPGETVTLTISLGPKRFACPDFRGLSRDAAQAMADSYGLKLDFKTVFGTSGSVVYSQSPGADTTVAYGDTITLYMV